MNQPGEHYAMFLGDKRHGWQQYAIMGRSEAQFAVNTGKGRVVAQDMVTGERLEAGQG